MERRDEGRGLLRTLQIDGVGSPVLGLALIAIAQPASEAVGLTARWPVIVLGVVLLVYGADNLLVARRPTRGTVGSLLAVDLVFAAGVLGIAVADPWGATALARGVMVALALSSATRRAISANSAWW
jgi:hypothetical protein